MVNRACSARVAQAGTDTRFLCDGTRLIAEYNGASTLLRRYVHGSGVDQPLVWYEGAGTSDKRRLYTDERGSVIAVEAAGGVIKNTYDAYGVPGAGNAGRFQYTGQAWLPEVSLYHYKARAYAPLLGRFLQTDPIGYADQMNLYAYVRNDPVNAIDPDGNEYRFVPGSSTAFKTDVSRVIVKAFLTGRGADFSTVMESKKIVTIQETKGPQRFDPATGTIYFNTRLGVETTEGEIQSPALGFVHENGHAKNYITDPVAQRWNSETRDPDFDDKEEANTIRTSENPTAKAWGEPTRNNHSGTPVEVGCVFCRVKIETDKTEE